MSDKADGENTSRQQALMEDVFHGSAGYASVLDLFMQGGGEFASIFDRVPIENNREGNELRTGGYALVMKDIFSCDEGARYILHARGFTKDALAQNKTERLLGRNIYERALVAIANYKFALKFHDEYCPGKDHPYPSGKGLDDMLLYVRRKMYVMLKGAKNKDGARRVKKPDGSFVEEDMPEKYMFQGYFVFVLYGPKMLTTKTLSCLSVDGKKCAKTGRATAREKELKIKAAERAANEGATGPYHRGLAVKDKYACATLAMSEYKMASRNVRDLLFHNNASESNCLTQLQQINSMLDRAEQRGDDREAKLLEARKVRLFDQLDQLSKRKRELEDESDRLMKRNKKTPQLRAYYESVGVFAVPKDVAVTRSTVDDGSSITNTDKTPRKIPNHCSQLTFSQQEELEAEDDTEKENGDDDLASIVEVLPRGSSQVSDEPVQPVQPLFTGMAARLPPEQQQILLQFREREAAGLTFAQQQEKVAAEERQYGRNGSSRISYQTGSTYYASVAQNDELNCATAHSYYGQEEDA
eukprot:Sro1741_g294620.2  (528) ;mRNA; f:3968-5628